MNEIVVSRQMFEEMRAKARETEYMTVDIGGIKIMEHPAFPFQLSNGEICHAAIIPHNDLLNNVEWEFAPEFNPKAIPLSSPGITLITTSHTPSPE